MSGSTTESPATTVRWSSGAALLGLALLTWMSSSVVTAAWSDRVAINNDRSDSNELPDQCDPTKVVSSERCANCHTGEFTTWKQTPHALTFERLHQMPEAKAIAQRMGFSSVKRGAMCLECHYTVQASSDKLKPVSGVSCESCHGAAAEWITLHNDYGGPSATREGESEAHRQERYENSVAAGMRNPQNLYAVAQSCLGCHTVRREDLVNHGGHKPGSLDFELVAWSQGQVRHNFLRTNNTANAPSSQERLRIMFVVGLMADLEYSTRATARATEVATFGLTSAQRAADRALKLKAIQDEIQNPWVQQALLAFASAELTTSNRVQLEAIADQIRDCGMQFAETADGSTLQAIDARLPSPVSYR